jgi:hypothetical protein
MIAVVKSTGKKIQVYKSSVRPHTWIDYSDCRTVYATGELEFKNA